MTEAPHTLHTPDDVVDADLLRKWLDGPYSRRRMGFALVTVRRPYLPWFARLWARLARRGGIHG
jgi:hypothetical protein